MDEDSDYYKKCVHAVQSFVQAFGEIPPTLKGTALIHTGILVSDTLDSWAETARKLRLMPLSFLASQDFGNTKLYYWTNVDREHPLIQEIFGPFLEQYGKHIEIKIKKFDAAEEIKKVVLDYASHENTAAMTAVTAELVNIFDSQTIASSKTNLMRTFLLYNYGAWMDNDMVLVQSVAPLLGDWAEWIGKGFINEAAFSASRPGSPFLKAYIGNIRKLGVHLEFFAYGPTMLSNMVKEIQNGRASLSYKFHLVPTCFFEGASHVHYFHGPDEEIPNPRHPRSGFSVQILQIH